MGFLVSFNRKMNLISQTQFLESKISDITAQKMDLTEEIANIQSSINDLTDKDSPSVQKLKARKSELEQLEKQLDIDLQKYQTKLEAANTEKQSADTMLQTNIKDSFSYGYGMAG